MRAGSRCSPPIAMTSTQPWARYLEGRGFDVVAFGSFNEENDHRAARTSPQSIRRAMLELGRKEEVEAVLLCCTSLRLVEAVGGDRGRSSASPSTSSNHALAWHCLRLAGIDDVLPGVRPRCSSVRCISLILSSRARLNLASWIQMGRGTVPAERICAC